VVGGGLFTGSSVALIVFWIVFGLVAFGSEARSKRQAGRDAIRSREKP
jgi:hypothetical protein